MTYEFKRLAEVEELTEAPENALALVEVDGAVKRAPMGGGNANLEEMIFDLDISSVSGSRITLANMDQVTKALNNNMTIRVVSTSDPSGVRYIQETSFPCIKDTVAFSEGPDFVGGDAFSGDNVIHIDVDPNDYVSGILTATNTFIMYGTQGVTIVRVYASIF